MEIGMLVELRRDRLLFTCQATLPILIILVTAVSCAGRTGELLFSAPVTDASNRPLVQRDERQPKVRREQPKTSTSPKIATEHSPNGTSAPVSRQPSKKANMPPELDAQREQQLYQEFLEWRKRQKDQP